MNFYNENNAFAAAWLRELIKANLIAPGIVDERSIKDLDYNELRQFRQVHLFAGVGGWSYALRLAGWPDNEPVWTGSCPCQPFSVAGKKQVDNDERHLWPAFRAAVAICKPAIVFGEQVASKDGRIWLAGVRADLEAMGYVVGGADLCAAGVGAPHIRQRLYWMAYTGSPSGFSRLADAQHDGQHRAQADAPEPGRDRQEIGVPVGSAPGLADAHSPQRGTGHAQGLHVPDGSHTGREETHSGYSIRGSHTGRLGDSQQPGLERLAGHVHDRDEPGRHDADASGSTAPAGSYGFWGDFELVTGPDKKSRRVKPALPLLVDGIPARVGRLRGYGNAIVPQVASEFIQAAREAIEMTYGK